MPKAKKVEKKKVVSKSQERRIAVQKEGNAEVTAEQRFNVVLRIPTVMYGYVEVAGFGTPDELMRVHAKFMNAYSALAKTAVRVPVEVKVAPDQKTATAEVAAPKEEEKPVPEPKKEAGASRVDEMFKKKGQEIETPRAVTMRSKSWILAEERLKSITDPNALAVLAGQVKKSEKMPKAEKPEFLALIKEREQELTNDLLVD